MAILFSNNYVSKLPSGYQELSYIESTGTQFIDSGIRASDSPNWAFEIEWQNTKEVGSWTRIFGQINDDPNFNVLQHSNDIVVYYNNGSSGGQYKFTTAYTLEKKHKLYFDNSKCIFDGSQYNKKSDSGNTSGSNFSLFKIRGENFSYRLFSCKIIYNGVAQRVFVPAKRKNDGTIGLYDTVSNTFFANGGSGTFLYREIPSMIDVENVIYNGTQLDKVIYNGVMVWESWKLMTGELLKGNSGKTNATPVTWTSSALSSPVKVRKVYAHGESYNADNFERQANVTVSIRNASTKVWKVLGTFKVRLFANGGGGGSSTLNNNDDELYDQLRVSLDGAVAQSKSVSGYISEWYQKG